MFENFKEFFRCTREYTLLNEIYSDEKIFDGLQKGSGFSSVYSAYQVYLLTINQVKDIVFDENLFYNTRIDMLQEICND